MPISADEGARAAVEACPHSASRSRSGDGAPRRPGASRRALDDVSLLEQEDPLLRVLAGAERTDQLLSRGVPGHGRCPLLKARARARPRVASPRTQTGGEPERCLEETTNAPARPPGQRHRYRAGCALRRRGTRTSGACRRLASLRCGVGFRARGGTRRPRRGGGGGRECSRFRRARARGRRGARSSPAAFALTVQGRLCGSTSCGAGHAGAVPQRFDKGSGRPYFASFSSSFQSSL